MKQTAQILTLIGLVFSMGSTSYGHEGHDQVPGALNANHGGIVKKGKVINLEYVVNGNEVSLFPASHEGKDLPAANVKMSATSKIPKGKAEPLKVEALDNVFKANVEFKGAYRSEISVTAEVDGKKDTFKFQVEK